MDEGTKMFQKGCSICTMEPVNTGRTKLLFKDNFCYIDENDRTVLVINKKTIFAEMRLTLSILAHVSIPNEAIVRRAKTVLINYIKTNLQLTNRDFIIRITMLTYPQHFHIHAYVLPFKDRNGTLVAAEVYERSDYLYHHSIPENIRLLVNGFHPSD